MSVSPVVVEEIVGALLKASPLVLDVIERIVKHERARRVADIRPEPGHGNAETAADELRTGRDDEPTRRDP